MDDTNSIKMVEVEKDGKVIQVALDKKCSKCTKSICCNSINQKIPAPKTKEDFDHLLWQVSHEKMPMVGSCTFRPTVVTCYHMVFAVFMKLAPGFVASMTTTFVSSMNPSRKRANYSSPRTRS